MIRRTLLVVALSGVACSTAHGQAPSASSINDLPPGPGLATAPFELARQRHVCVLVPTESVQVHAPASARVIDVAVRIGDQVEAGAALMTLDARQAQDELALLRNVVDEAGADVALAQAEQARAAQEAERIQSLVAAGVAPRQTADEADAAERAARLRVRRARAALGSRQADLQRSRHDVAATVVHAPKAGTVAQRSAEPGSLVAAGALLLRLVSDSTPLVRCALPFELARQLRGSERVELSASGAAAFPATVQRVAPEADPVSQLVVVELATELRLPAGTAAWWPGP